MIDTNKVQNQFLGVVQFIHPGAEHRVDKNSWTSWNLTNHRRKFMAVSGRSINFSDQNESSGLYLWGEWEGPSRSIFSWPNKSDAHPKHLVLPQYPGHAKQVNGLQNTDPYIFGNQFKYTLCKQVNKNGVRNFLTRLQPGTLILFGSNVKKKFVLDTVMVVGESTVHHTIEDWESALASCSDTYKAMTLEPMYFDGNIRKETKFTFYQGATDHTPFNNTFSFVPCVRETNLPQGFERPNVVLPDAINQGLMMAQKGTPMSLSAIQECWLNIKSQVFDHGLCLGVEIDEPEKVSVPDYLWPH